jgi:hypothetical protein
MSQRFDSGVLKRPKRLANGFLRTDAFVTRIGVFGYLSADGSVRRELRHPDEVFSADSLDSLAMLPVTAEHPPQLLSAENARKYSVGTTGETARRDDRFVRSTVQVQDAKTIAKVEAGEMRELSCGYRCDKDETPGITAGIPGVPDGLNYDLIQRNIQYNHIALTAHGRAGPECSVPRMDGIDGDTAVMVTDSDERQNTGPQPELPWSGTMDATIRIDGIEYKATAQAAQAFKQYVERADKAESELQAKVTDVETALEKEKARADAAEDKAKKAEQERTDALKPENLQAQIKARVSLEHIGRRVLGEKTEDGKEIELDGMSDLELKTAVIKKTTPEANLDGKSEDYISARYDHAVESLPVETNKDADRARAAVHTAATGKKQSDVIDASEARQRMIERQENAWKPKEQSSN